MKNYNLHFGGSLKNPTFSGVVVVVVVGGRAGDGGGGGGGGLGQF